MIVDGDTPEVTGGHRTSLNQLWLEKSMTQPIPSK
jgi:hypothetical protein